MAALTKHRFFAWMLTLLLAACSAPLSPAATPLRDPTPVKTASAPPAGPASEPTMTPEALPASRSLHMSDAAIGLFQQGLTLPQGLHMATPGQPSDVFLREVNDPRMAQSTWVFALVAPFPTIVDNVPLADLRAAWKGQSPDAFDEKPLLMSARTLATISFRLGAPADGAVRVLEPEALLDAAWEDLPAWAIVPFEELEPRWKVLSIAGQSPLSQDFDPAIYPLTVYFGLTGAEAASVPTGWIPATNRDPQKLTVLVMTGVTALARGTAERMDAEGVTYPAEKIGDWLRDADLAHISNEVSFFADCPLPERRDPRFCSNPAYIGLLDAVGTDIVELTGNHLLDWGAQPFLDTLEAYRQRGWGVYGGGADLDAARAPLRIEDHGNRLAFLGCNPAGPQTDWAGEDMPGTTPCDYDWLTAEVGRLSVQGYLVVVTFQHIEVCTLEPHLSQKADFQKPANAGAVIVSGSQAHCPQAIALGENQFIHYGLGNLFFDQTDMFASRVMVDRHVIYNGQHISTELLTAQLEDRAQPRPMTIQERQKLLEDVFRASGWLP